MNKIYVASEQLQEEWFHSIALAEDGTALAGHASSTLAWAYRDMGVHPESNWKHAHYDAHYGAGNWELEWVDDPANHEGFQAALKLNQAHAMDKSKDEQS